MLLLSDNEFFEGILGGFGWIIAIYYIRYSLKQKGSNINLAILGLITWATLWYIRKVGLRLYKDFKKMRNIKERGIKLNLGESKLHHHFWINLIFLGSIYFFIIRNAPIQTNKLLKISKLDITLLSFMFLLGTVVYLH